MILQLIAWGFLAFFIILVLVILRSIFKKRPEGAPEIKKWTYEELKDRNPIAIYVHEDGEVKKFNGIVSGEIKEDMPYINAKKGDFWIDVPTLNRKLIGKLDCIFQNARNYPYLVFDNKTEWIKLN